MHSLLINTTGRWLADDSDNLYAEVFARTLGAFFTPANQTSSSTLNDGLALIAQVPSAIT
jgi:D-alanyl-D-alanine carboxypeptidase